MNKKIIAIVVAVLELLSAIPLYGIYTMAIRYYGTDNYWSLTTVGMNSLGLLFLVLPVLALVGVIKGWRSAYLWMGLFPVVAFMFGVVPFPFATYFYSKNVDLNTALIAATNIAVIFVTIWLFLSTRTRSNNAPKRTV